MTQTIPITAFNTEAMPTSQNLSFVTATNPSTSSNENTLPSGQLLAGRGNSRARLIFLGRRRCYNYPADKSDVYSIHIALEKYH